MPNVLFTISQWKSLIEEIVAPLDYADSHAKVMSAIADLHIINYDIVFAKDGHVLLKYSAEGSHCGQPHNGIEPSGKEAKWVRTSPANYAFVQDNREPRNIVSKLPLKALILTWRNTIDSSCYL